MDKYVLGKSFSYVWSLSIVGALRILTVKKPITLFNPAFPKCNWPQSPGFLFV